MDFYNTIQKVQDVATFSAIAPYIAEMKMREHFKKNDMHWRYFGLIKDGRYMYRATTDSEALEDAKKAGKPVSTLYHK
jgi:hydrogenase maturation factor